MSKKATTKITVDTDKLRNEKPGKIQDRSIVVMKDESGDNDYKYKDSTDKNYKDNLIQKVDQGADREWTIEATNKKDDVSFVKFVAKNPLELYTEIPVKEGAKKVKTKIKKGITVHTEIQYTFYIKFDEKEYFWDPMDETRKP